MKKLIIIFVIIALLGGGGYYFYYKRTVQSKNITQSFSEKEQSFYTVKAGSIVKTISANGYILPVKEKDLQFLANGRVQKVMIKEGDRVKEGQLLGTLENSSEELSLLKAKHNYETALINNSKSVQAERKLEYQIAEQNYNNTFLKAPFSGLVTGVAIEVEDQVNNSKTVAHLIDDSSYLITVNIDEVDIAQIKEGQRVTVTLEAFPKKQLIGEVVSIGYIAENQSGVVVIPVEIAVKNVDSSVKPGLSAEVEIVIGQAKDMPLIPVTAMLQRPDGMYVMKKEEGKVNAVKIVPGITNDTMVAVVSGLVEGDEIVVNNYQMIEEIRNRMQQRNSFGGSPMMPMGNIRTPSNGGKR